MFVFPAQSNFNGLRYDLDKMLKRVRSEKIIVVDDANKNNAETRNSDNNKKEEKQRCIPRDWLVCLDTASYLASSPLSLTHVKPDFAVMSFYKLFGFPTSLGALLIRKTDNVRASFTFKRFATANYFYSPDFQFTSFYSYFFLRKMMTFFPIFFFHF